MDPDLAIPTPSLTIDQGAIKPWGADVSTKKSWSGLRVQILEELGVPFDVPWNRIPIKLRRQALYGTGDREFEVRWSGKRGGKGTFVMTWEGVLPRLMRRFREAGSERAKRWHSQFLAQAECSTCAGTRLRPESAAVRVGGRTIVEISADTVEESRRYFTALRLEGAAGQIAREILKEILMVLVKVRGVVNCLVLQ